MALNTGHDAVSAVLARLRNVQPKQTGGWEGLCPAHDDERRSLSIGQGDDGTVLLKCHAGCTVQSIVDALGLTLRDLFPSANGHLPFNVVASYDYRSEDGELLFQVCRLLPKDFRQRRPGPRGDWTWKLNGVRRVLYNLPELLAAPAEMIVWICEGEKDAETLRDHELLATTNPGGAGKWRTEYNEMLRGRPVVILPDNDRAGRNHARDVAASLDGVAASVTTLELPDLPPKGDVTDWFEAGGTASKLFELLEAAKRARDANTTAISANSETHCDPLGDRRVLIDAGHEDLAAVTPVAIQALVASNNPPRLFRHSGPARIERDDNDAPFVCHLKRDRMRYELARAARFTREKKNGFVDAYPPRPVVEDVLATPELPLPVLVRLIEAPTFATDGTLHDQPGYHPATRAFYEPSPGFALPPIPKFPNVEQIRDAVALLNEPLRDFPFVGNADRAHAIAALILPFVRDMIEGPTPLHSCEAPSPGSGKTLLVRVISYPALGRPVTAMTEGKNEDEWRKRVFAKLRGGPSALLLDNLRGRVDSAAFASALTAYPDWEDRVLGVSETARVPVRCVWLATGNNPAFSNEMTRRTIRIRVDPKQDLPWLRNGFTHENLSEWVKLNRAQLVAAVLTIVRAWISAGRPCGNNILGMFESWAKVIGGILNVAGIQGFLGNLVEFYADADAEGAIVRAFVKMWWTNFAEREVTTADLWSIATEVSLNLGDGTERSQKTRLGKTLGENRDRTFTIELDSAQRISLRLEHRGINHHAARWALRATQ